jgi:peptidoglycan/xylan/chitin deacetylase (PgdA/CDA1 family)
VTGFRGEARRVLRCLWAHILKGSGCLWWAKRQLRRSGAVIPLTFHRVLRDADYRGTHSLPGVILRERTFRDLAAHVARRCEPVDLRRAEPGKLSPKLRVAFTFDDGWVDTYTVAFPIAREHDIPLVVFVCPGLIDQDAPFWPERVVAQLRTTGPSVGSGEAEVLIEKLKRATTEEREQYLAKLRVEADGNLASAQPPSADRTLSWSAIAEMGGRGVRFGSHTQTHQILTTIGPEAACQEVRDSKAAIERALNKVCDSFAYPNGNHSPETREILAGAGFKLAVTTTRGAWTTTCDCLAVPRSNICEENVVGPSRRFSATIFEYSTFWKAWKAAEADSRLKGRAHHQPAPVTVSEF